MSTTRAKIVDFRTEKRKVNSKRAAKVRETLMVEEVVKDLAQLDRLWAADAAQLIEASQIGGAEQ